MQIKTISFLWTIISLVLPLGAQAVSINERARNNFRTAANKQEFILNKNNVNADQFHLLHVHDFDAKVETQPLVVEKGAGNDDLIIVTTMKNEVIGINARTNARVYKEKLGTEINSSGTQDMDMFGHTPTWGISATPIIDAVTDTLFVAAWVRKNDNNHRDYWVFSLDPKTGKKKASPMKGDVNKHFGDAQLVAYDATTILPGNKLKRLFRTGDDNHGGLGTMTRMAPPVVANGRVYVMIYRVDNGNLVGSQLKVFG
ncbi:MAG: hypothetical protein QX198_04955, partial [Methylococcaceae bacterium]